MGAFWGCQTDSPRHNPGTDGMQPHSCASRLPTQVGQPLAQPQSTHPCPVHPADPPPPQRGLPVLTRVPWSL